MAFEPGPKYRTATDDATGAMIAVYSTGSSMNSMKAEYTKPQTPSLSLKIWLKDVSGEPNVIINVPALETNLQAQGRTNEAENTQLIRYILQGLAIIDRKWALMRATQFGSNYEYYAQKGMKFSFSMPGNEELKRLLA